MNVESTVFIEICNKMTAILLAPKESYKASDLKRCQGSGLKCKDESMFSSVISEWDTKPVLAEATKIYSSPEFVFKLPFYFSSSTVS